jgi:hypothetical protein
MKPRFIKTCSSQWLVSYYLLEPSPVYLDREYKYKSIAMIDGRFKEVGSTGLIKLEGNNCLY